MSEVQDASAGPGDTVAAAEARRLEPGELAYFEGEFVPLSQARIPITTHAFNYGTGCFEGIRAYWNQERRQLYVLRLREHLERLVRSARILKLDFEADLPALESLMRELLARNGYQQDAYLRPIVYKAGSTIKVALTGIETGFCAYTIPMGDYLDIERGLTLTISAWRRIEDNAIPARGKPTGAYINAAMASDEARLKGFDEAVMLTSDGHVAEASSANLFLFESGVLVTPETADEILVGVTRGCVVELARHLGYGVEVRRVDRSELLSAEEVFLCGTGVQIAPVVGIDGRPVGGGRPGEVTMSLQRAYLDIVRGVRTDFDEWRTPVYRDRPATGG
ncbi:MAG: branched-chain amino acid transaminase [Candidatus Dormibacteraceae bacterium]